MTLKKESNCHENCLVKIRIKKLISTSLCKESLKKFAASIAFVKLSNQKLRKKIQSQFPVCLFRAIHLAEESDKQRIFERFVMTVSLENASLYKSQPPHQADKVVFTVMRTIFKMNCTTECHRLWRYSLICDFVIIWQVHIRCYPFLVSILVHFPNHQQFLLQSQLKPSCKPVQCHLLLSTINR